jgi:hypothetical protein
MHWFIALFSLLIACGSFAHPHQQSFMPDNNLWQEDRQQAANITEEEFNQILDDIEAIYQPIISSFGASFQLERAWSDSTVNAYADQKGKTWIVHMYGGMARRAEMNVAGFGLVACHEIGHHLGGFPKWASSTWASNEGNSDFYANYVCAPMAFKRLPVPAISGLPKEKCDAAWPDQDSREACYKALNGGQALGNLLAKLNKMANPDYATPDPSVVTKTKDEHPKAQCRLDTYLAGSLCTKAYDVNSIPKDEFSFCDNRPKCWFKGSGNPNPNPNPDPNPNPEPEPTDPNPNADYALMGEINHMRIDLNKEPLIEEDLLTCASWNHVSDIAPAKKCSHQGANGSTVGQRMKTCGWTKQFTELVACGFADEEAAVAAWMRSFGNRFQINSAKWKSVGCSSQEKYYVCVFGN